MRKKIHVRENNSEKVIAIANKRFYKENKSQKRETKGERKGDREDRKTKEREEEIQSRHIS